MSSLTAWMTLKKGAKFWFSSTETPFMLSCGSQPSPRSSPNVKRHQSNELPVWLYRVGQVIRAHPSNKLTSISNFWQGQSLSPRRCFSVYLSAISLLWWCEAPCARWREVAAHVCMQQRGALWDCSNFYRSKWGFLINCWGRGQKDKQQLCTK